MSETIPQEVVGKLRAIIAKYKNSAIYKDIVEPRDSVFARYQPVFSPENLSKISSEEFQGFWYWITTSIGLDCIEWDLGFVRI